MLRRPWLEQNDAALVVAKRYVAISHEARGSQVFVGGEARDFTACENVPHYHCISGIVADR